MANMSNWFRKPVSCTLYYPGAYYPVCELSVNDRNLLMGNVLCLSSVIELNPSYKQKLRTVYVNNNLSYVCITYVKTLIFCSWLNKIYVLNYIFV